MELIKLYSNQSNQPHFLTHNNSIHSNHTTNLTNPTNPTNPNNPNNPNNYLNASLDKNRYYGMLINHHIRQIMLGFGVQNYPKQIILI
jgi:hypothetical protein